MVEYAMLLSLVALALVGAIGGMAGQVGGRFNAISNTLASGGNGGLGPGTTVPDGGGGGTVTPPPTTNNGGSGNNNGGVPDTGGNNGGGNGTAFAVLTEDGQLLFYKRSDIPSDGESFEGRKIKYVYKDIETRRPYNAESNPWYQARTEIRRVEVCDYGIAPVSCAGWFKDLGSLTDCDVSRLDTSKVTDMNNMFASVTLNSLYVSNFDTSSVRDMSQMFYASNIFNNLDLSTFETSKVTNMRQMFQQLSVESLNISGFDTSNVTNMEQMFYDSDKLQIDCSKLDVSKVTKHSYFNFGAPGVIPPAWV